MASLGVVGYSSLRSSVRENKYFVVVLLRVLSLLATLSATIVMSLNKETKTFVVATIGTTSIKASLTAKFQDTPANIFFVVANGLATLHNILALLMGVERIGKKLDTRGFRVITIPTLDIINLAILSAGVSSATFMASLAKNGNSHAQWNKICDKFDTFCKHGAGAILASFIGLVILLVITLISNIRVRQSEKEITSSIDV